MISEQNKLRLRRENLGSPIFSKINPQLLAGESTVFDLNINASIEGRYAPFNFFIFQNNSPNVTVRIYINQSNDFFLDVLPSTIRTLDKKSIPAVSSLRIENLSASTLTAGALRIEYQREVIDEETIIHKIAQRILR